MLTRDETDQLCRVGPGTPMGALMREYWLPAAYEWELEPGRPAAAGAPVGRGPAGVGVDSEGNVAFTQQRCPHRGAGLFFGRNEAGGLRCAYHGWKFDVNGSCIDMPNEPPTSNFKNKMKITSYKGAGLRRRGVGLHGPQAGRPSRDAAIRVGGLCPRNSGGTTGGSSTSATGCRRLEGELDSTHAPILHGRLHAEDDPKYGGYTVEKVADFYVEKTVYGLVYGAERKQPDGKLLLARQPLPLPLLRHVPRHEFSSAPVPSMCPSTTTTRCTSACNGIPPRSCPAARFPTPELPGRAGCAVAEPRARGSPSRRAPSTPTGGRRFSPETDFHMDLWAKKNKNFTGIPSVRQQDAAIEWSMGAIMDRTKEHLGTADASIIRGAAATAVGGTGAGRGRHATPGRRNAGGVQGALGRSRAAGRRPVDGGSGRLVLRPHNRLP